MGQYVTYLSIYLSKEQYITLFAYKILKLIQLIKKLSNCVFNNSLCFWLGIS